MSDEESPVFEEEPNLGEEASFEAQQSMDGDYPVFDEEQVPMYEEETPFEGAEFVDNPEPRCPCVLLLDTSTSMRGQPIDELNAGLQAFRQELMEDELAAKRVEVAVVSFGPVTVETDFQTPDVFTPPTLEANGETPMGSAIEQALSMVQERKETYKQNGINYYRPWVFLITDGAPTDPWGNAAQAVQAGEQDGSIAFFPVGVQDANMDVLAKLSKRTPLKLQGLQFQDLFAWLSKSLQRVSQSQLGTEVSLPAPTSWAEI